MLLCHVISCHNVKWKGENGWLCELKAECADCPADCPAVWQHALTLVVMWYMYMEGVLLGVPRLGYVQFTMDSPVSTGPPAPATVEPAPDITSGWPHVHAYALCIGIRIDAQLHILYNIVHSHSPSPCSWIYVYCSHIYNIIRVIYYLY